MTAKSNEDRVTFLSDYQVMEVDFSDMTFSTSSDINAFYDVVDSKIEATGEKWYFLVNYRNCHVLPEAWIAHAHRGKKVNLAFSLGTVRYDASPKTAEEIRAKSQTDDFDPNLFPSREEALARLVQLRRDASA